MFTRTKIIAQHYTKSCKVTLIFLLLPFSWFMYVLYRKMCFYVNMHQNAFGGRASSGPKKGDGSVKSHCEILCMPLAVMTEP